MNGRTYVNENSGKCCSVPNCDRGQRTNGLCGKHYQRYRTHGAFDLPKRQPREWKKCSIDGCGNNSRTICGSLCEMHYYRMRRTGAFDAHIFARQWRVSTNGYISRRHDSHPLSSLNGTLYQHRAVLWDKIGDGQHPCHWCGIQVQWKLKGKRKLVVDHLDGNKQNNNVSNLVPSCHACNANRGLFQSWVMRHKDDPFLWSLYLNAKKAA